MLSDYDIVERFEDEGIETTDNPFEAIYLLRNGTLISGMFYGMIRSEDHRCVQCLFDDIDRYTPNFWERIIRRTGMIILIPETEQALVPPYLRVTSSQQAILDELDYQIVEE